MTETIKIDDFEIEGLTPNQKATLEALAAGATPGEIKGMTPDEIESVYAMGYNLHVAQQYDRAEPLFAWACLYGMAEPRYWMALGNCRQGLKKYKDAIEAYGFCFMLDPDSAWGPLHCAVCHLAMGDKESARDAVEMAERAVAQGRPDAAATQRAAAIRLAL